MLITLIVLFSDCQRITVDEISQMSKMQIANIMRQPIIITNGMNQWNNISIDEFKEKFGNHKILARRTNFASHMDNKKFGSYLERLGGVKKVDDAPHVTVSDFLLYSSREHIILFDEEPGMSMEEEYLLNSIEPLRKIPNVLSRASETLFFSFGGATNGVNVANHGFTWIGLLLGKKIWYVAPPDVEKPKEPKCSRIVDENEAIPNTLKCLQHSGEIFVLPTAWWHATCNLEYYGIGIGGQDSCDLGCQNRVEKGEPFCVNEEHYLKCW